MEDDRLVEIVRKMHFNQITNPHCEIITDFWCATEITTFEPKAISKVKTKWSEVEWIGVVCMCNSLCIVHAFLEWEFFAHRLHYKYWAILNQ